MQHPAIISHQQQSGPQSRRYAGLVLAAAVNVVAIWAILNGLNLNPVHTITPTTIIKVLTPTAPPKPMQPPQPVMRKPVSNTDAVPKPIIDVPPATPGPIVTTPPQQTPPQPANAIPDSAALAIGDTHTTPPYPTDARRFGRQGVVTLQLAIDATGRVTNAQVKSSSGDPELDQTAIDWVTGHWRYKPAVQNGVPVASAALASVKFSLRDAR